MFKSARMMLVIAAAISLSCSRLSPLAEAAASNNNDPVTCGSSIKLLHDPSVRYIAFVQHNQIACIF